MNKPTNPKDAVSIGKVSMSSVPVSVLLEVAAAMFEGNCKHGFYNYRVAGARSSVYYDATMRHITAWWEGEDIDDVSSLSHITKAISSLVVLRDAMLNDLVTDDRPPRPKVQIGKHIEALNDLCADLIVKHKDADVTHYTHVEHGAVDLDDEPRAVNRTRRTRAQIEADNVLMVCQECGVPGLAPHRAHCSMATILHPTKPEDIYKDTAVLLNAEVATHLPDLEFGGAEYKARLAALNELDEKIKAGRAGQLRPTFDESANFDVVPAGADMSDPKNWQAGDLIVALESRGAQFTKGKEYIIDTIGARNVLVVADDRGVCNGWAHSNFAWHSRPTPGAKP